ncbi:MAG: hypothetical protein M3305_02340 [Actinomycetota bacterium]|nr:hypothetical protein [Actinomycetota bacterium]
MSVLRTGPLFWFLLLSVAVSGWFFVLAVDNKDRPLAWSAAIVFVLLCAAAVLEMLT